MNYIDWILIVAMVLAFFGSVCCLAYRLAEPFDSASPWGARMLLCFALILAPAITLLTRQEIKEAHKAPVPPELRWSFAFSNGNGPRPFAAVFTETNGNAWMYPIEYGTNWPPPELSCPETPK